MGERHQNPHGNNLRGTHPWARELFGPYLLGVLDPEEERAVERHIAGCAVCQEEERGLRETHVRLAGASIAASSAPPDLKARLLTALPPRDGSETPIGLARSSSRFTSRMVRLMIAASMVLLTVALPTVAYSSGFFDQTSTAATLTPTELAPGAGGGLEVEGSGPNVEASLEVWGLPRTGPDEYYELWFSKDGGRLSAGTFKVDPEGQGKLSGSVPELSGDYQRVGVTLEKFPEEPRIDSAKAVLGGDLQKP